jgi:hypothetical protein
VVLKESQHMLKNVRYIFCEYHYIQKSIENGLEDILQILDDEASSNRRLNHSHIQDRKK